MSSLWYPSVKQAPLSMGGMGGLAGSTTFAQGVCFGEGGSNYYDGNDATQISGSGADAFELNSSTFCIECYIMFKTDSYPNTYRSIWHRWGNTGMRCQTHSRKFGDNNFGIYCWFSGESGSNLTFSIENLFDPFMDKWYHLAWVRSGTGSNEFRVYCNGTSVYQNTLNLLQTDQNDEPLAWGGREDVSNYDSVQYLSNCRWVVGNSVYGTGSSTISVPTTLLTAVSGTKFLGMQSTTDANAGTCPSNTTISTKRGSPTPSDINPMCAF